MKRSAFLIACAALIGLMLLALATPTQWAAARQTVQPTPTDFFAAIGRTPGPTAGPGYIGVPQYPLAVLGDGTAIPSLTGVGGKSDRGPAAIRSGPGLSFPRIGRVAPNAWIHIVGWNGWTVDRGCTPDFANDLDMWVQVQTHLGEVRGWTARCVLTIIGDVSALPIVDAAGNRTFQR
ncbi:MAG: hypothetical protein SGJ24_12260 [Chloroflexota bacterium]|nr:hypothetical protein [Chloroflexota bacterium]